MPAVAPTVAPVPAASPASAEAVDHPAATPNQYGPSMIVKEYPLIFAAEKRYFAGEQLPKKPHHNVMNLENLLSEGPSQAKTKQPVAGTQP